MPKILVEIDTNNLFRNTTTAQDEEILSDMLCMTDDKMLVAEVVNRNLLADVFAESRESEKQALMDEWAEEYGYIKKM